MILNSMTFEPGDEGVVPATITVTMTVAEAAAIARLFGKLNSHGYARLGLSQGDNDIYDCLVGDVLNRYWEDGVNDVLPEVASLSSINEAP